ncbi:beta-1,6-N-acetylglucosaminyltransferase [Sodalis ligni]|uniref:Peptide O-xylosyltransferase n=1 Tax=Sodalis ligni TaxID=2697027 RepID=A0A4R1NIF9_9GAMM|nr:beta-1,6-N-acetylglucosaminyltransferase [Sodalis ligni]TCL07343.1 core-2/I-Branching enzyme [Sodalis ligni]
MDKIAYLILAHNDPIHLERLIKSLDYQCDFYIHIDKKVDIAPFVKSLRDNMTFSTKRYAISWAGISMVNAQLELLRLSLQNEYSHVVFLSGSDYPIKTAKYIHAYITESEKKEFIKLLDMRDSPEHYLKQVTLKWFNEPILQINGKFTKIADKILRKFLTSLRLKNNWDSRFIPYFGSQWIAITGNCGHYILDFYEKNPTYHEANKFSFSPDEHYFHSIIGNSPYLENTDGVTTYVGRGTWRLANLHVIDPTLAKWYTLQDWEEIVNSQKLFVRKVRTLDGENLLDKIDQELLNP